MGLVDALRLSTLRPEAGPKKDENPWPLAKTEYVSANSKQLGVLRVVSAPSVFQ